MNAEALRARLAGLSTHPPPDPQAPGDGADPAGRTLVPAAVLVPIVLADEPGIILTKRTAHLTRHAGQVSFPGGRIDPSDRTPEAAALREAHEEIGLDPASVELRGQLPPFITNSGYRITPVVGLLPELPAFHPAPGEVEAVFELPVCVLLDPTAPQRQMWEDAGGRREIWVWPHPDHFIWGATAAILMHLAQLLRGEGAG